MRDVAALAASFAGTFGWAEVGRVAGLLHDVGKCSPDFLAYLQGLAPSPDHSTAGARIAAGTYPGPLGRILAAAIAAHHAGLADEIDTRLDASSRTIPDYRGWETIVGGLPKAGTLSPSGRWRNSGARGFREAFLIRMLLSALVDADRLATERFYAEAEGRNARRGGHSSLAVLRDRLRSFMERKAREAEPSPINALRAEVLAHATGHADAEPGLFTLTVPTGGGKTLASLSFVLEHAVRHGLRRVIFVVPFTSIIEQTAGVFREALAAGAGASNDADVLEHHASFDWERAAGSGEAGAGTEPVRLSRSEFVGPRRSRAPGGGAPPRTGTCRS